MAYVQDQNDPNAQQPAAQNAPMNQLPSTASGLGAGAVGTNPAPGGSNQGASAVPNTTQAPPVQNLQAYLTANQPQAVQMGQTIASGLTNQAAQVSGDINADQAATDAQVQAQNTPVNQTLIDQAAANPSQFVQDPNNVSQFQAQENANYTGPATFESTPDYQTLTNEVTNAQGNAPDINTSAGVNQLVRGQEQNPTLGMSNLDQLLLQETPEAMAPIAAAEAPFAALPGQLSGAATTEDAAIQAAIANDQVAPQAVNSAFLTGPNAVVPAFEASLPAEVQAAIAQRDAANSGLSSYEQSLQPNNQDLNALNSALMSQTYTKEQLANPYTQYLSQTAEVPVPSQASVSTAKDYATDAALSTLLGTGYTPQLNQANASQAGTYQAPSYNEPSLLSIDQPLYSELMGSGAPFDNQSLWGNTTPMNQDKANRWSAIDPSLESLLGLLEGQGVTPWWE